MTRVEIIQKDGTPVDAANPVPVTFGSSAITIENASIRLDSALDSVTVEPGASDLNVSLDGELVGIDNTADIKVTLDSELVGIDNTVDIKVTLDSEQVSLAETYEGGTDLNETPPKGVVAMIVKDGYVVPINDDGNDVPVRTKASPVVIGPITIAAEDSLSSEIDLNGVSNIMIEMPVTFDGEVLTFQVSRTSGGTYKDVYDDNKVEVSIDVGLNTMVGVDLSALKMGAARFLKIRSGPAATPVTQTAARELYIIAA